MLFARVVELADSLDSGSSAHYGRAGSSPASRTIKKDIRLDVLLFYCYPHLRQTPEKFLLHFAKRGAILIANKVGIHLIRGLIVPYWYGLSGIEFGRILSRYFLL